MKKAYSTGPKKDVYEIVTEQVIALLEKGTAPWQKPWRSFHSVDAPRNFVSKKPYRGWNYFFLSCAPYDCPYWVSYKQAADLGGSVKKGEKATIVVYWTFLPRKDEKGAPIIKDGKPVTVPFLRYYNVFNLEQCEGIEWSKPVAPVRPDFNPIAECEKIVAEMPLCPVIKHQGARACYSPALDLVYMPARDTFQSPEHYYHTLFHELTHSTGHKTRLARKEILRYTEGEAAAFGDESYSREELVAEMGAAFLSGFAGIVAPVVNNSASYLANWVKVLKGDSKLVVIAAAQAQKAADFILGDKAKETAPEGEGEEPAE